MLSNGWLFGRDSSKSYPCHPREKELYSSDGLIWRPFGRSKCFYLHERASSSSNVGPKKNLHLLKLQGMVIKKLFLQTLQELGHVIGGGGLDTLDAITKTRKFLK